MALSVGQEVSAGVGDAVDLMEGVRQISDAGCAHGIRVPCRGGEGVKMITAVGVRALRF